MASKKKDCSISFTFSWFQRITLKKSSLPYSMTHRFPGEMQCTSPNSKVIYIYQKNFIWISILFCTLMSSFKFDNFFPVAHMLMLSQMKLWDMLIQIIIIIIFTYFSSLPYINWNCGLSFSIL